MIRPRVLLSLLDASLRNSVAILSADSSKAPCREDDLTIPTSLARNIAVELKADGFIQSAWSPLARFYRKRKPQTLHLGQPRFWLHLLGPSQKCRLIIQVQSDVDVITNRVLVDMGKGDPVEWIETEFTQ